MNRRSPRPPPRSVYGAASSRACATTASSAASKGAVLGLTKSLARELGPFGIRVNAVAPGAVVSDAEERVFGDRLAEYNRWILENQSVKRRIEAADIAELVLFLASPASDMISGQNIGIDGGW